MHNRSVYINVTVCPHLQVVVKLSQLSKCLVFLIYSQLFSICFVKIRHLTVLCNLKIKYSHFN